MNNIIRIVTVSIASFQVLAADASKWFYPNGELVPESQQYEILKKCRFEEAADKIANAKEGEFDAAFAMLMQARDCIISSGVSIEGMSNK